MMDVTTAVCGEDCLKVCRNRDNSKRGGCFDVGLIESTPLGTRSKHFNTNEMHEGKDIAKNVIASVVSTIGAPSAVVASVDKADEVYAPSVLRGMEEANNFFVTAINNYELLRDKPPTDIHKPGAVHPNLSLLSFGKDRDSGALSLGVTISEIIEFEKKNIDEDGYDVQNDKVVNKIDLSRVDFKPMKSGTDDVKGASYKVSFFEAVSDDETISLRFEEAPQVDTPDGDFSYRSRLRSQNGLRVLITVKNFPYSKIPGTRLALKLVVLTSDAHKMALKPATVVDPNTIQFGLRSEGPSKSKSWMSWTDNFSFTSGSQNVQSKVVPDIRIDDFLDVPYSVAKSVFDVSIETEAYAIYFSSENTMKASELKWDFSFGFGAVPHTPKYFIDNGMLENGPQVGNAPKAEVAASSSDLSDGGKVLAKDGRKGWEYAEVVDANELPSDLEAEKVSEDEALMLAQQAAATAAEVQAKYGKGRESSIEAQEKAAAAAAQNAVKELGLDVNEQMKAAERARNAFHDNDGDGNTNAADADADGDGKTDKGKVDANKDGIDDRHQDTDGDGLNDHIDADADGDGKVDDDKKDTDDDGVADFADADADGDGKTDEGKVDANKDGIDDRHQDT
eukprot:g2547.t1